MPPDRATPPDEGREEGVGLAERFLTWDGRKGVWDAAAVPELARCGESVAEREAIRRLLSVVRRVVIIGRPYTTDLAMAAELELLTSGALSAYRTAVRRAAFAEMAQRMDEAAQDARRDGAHIEAVEAYLTARNVILFRATLDPETP